MRVCVMLVLAERFRSAESKLGSSLNKRGIFNFRFIGNKRIYLYYF